MNIFAVSESTKLCAMALDDIRLQKMVLETTQMLSTAAGHDYDWMAEQFGIEAYKATHRNHPCTLWIGQTSANYAWGLDLFRKLSAEYTRRSGGKVHKCWREQRHALFALAEKMPHGPRTPFARATKGFDWIEDTHQAYMAVLSHKWRNDKREPKWTTRVQPAWAFTGPEPR